MYIFHIFYENFLIYTSFNFFIIYTLVGYQDRKKLEGLTQSLWLNKSIVYHLIKQFKETGQLAGTKKLL